MQTNNCEQSTFNFRYERPLTILSHQQAQYTAEKDKEVYIPLEGFYTITIQNLSSTDLCYLYGFEIRKAETKYLSPEHPSDLFLDE